LLKWLKELCDQCKCENPRQYNLHSFRHHFASLCANHHVAIARPLHGLVTTLRKRSICTIIFMIRIVSRP
jgi:hypothetical protein